MNARAAAPRLALLPGAYAICRLPAGTPAPPLPAQGGFFSVTRTPDELSVVCQEELAPAGALCQRGWRCLRVLGAMDLGIVGVLAGLTTPLAAAGIPVFALSTYDTDYLLVRGADAGAALAALREAGYEADGGVAAPEEDLRS